MAEGTQQITVFLSRIKTGDQSAQDELFRLLYDDLRRNARRHFKGERLDHTLQATALVNEAYLRLNGGIKDLVDRRHFFAMFATAMRHVLVDHAKNRAAEKRGGGHRKFRLEEIDTPPSPASCPEFWITLSDSLDQFAQIDSRRADVFNYRYFSCLETKEVAELLGVAERTIQDDYAIARAWLRTNFCA